MKTFTIFVIFCAYVFCPTNSPAGSLESRIRAFSELHSSRAIRGRHEAINFGTPDIPVYVILNGISPDAVPTTGNPDDIDGILDSEILGNDGEWVLGPSGPCHGCGEGMSVAVFSCLRRDGTDGECDSPRPPDVFSECNGYAGCADCLEILSAGGTTSGVYPTSSGLNVWCDQDSAGGGWTLVSRQYPGSGVKWNGGGMAAYDPDFASLTSFSLPAGQLPTGRSQTGFGQDANAVSIGYADFVYTCGNIAKTKLLNRKNGAYYHIHRNTASRYSYHDPESPLQTTESKWFDTLTFDRTGGVRRSWAYSPRYGTGKGQGMAGVDCNTHPGSCLFSWTVWVR